MKTILIVDDESTVRIPMQEFLRLSTNYIILTAIDSDQALEHFNKKQIDLMVTNIIMNCSTMNGIELTRYVTERYYTKVIIATAMDCYQDEACDAGAIEYILKPIRFESLLKLINNILLIKRNATIRNYSTAINELQSKIPHPSDYGLSQKEADRLHILTDSGNASGDTTATSFSIGLIISLGTWFWCTLGWWEWQSASWFFAIIASLFVGILPCMLICVLLSSQIIKIERLFINKEKADVYLKYTKEKDEAEEKYLSAYKKLGISFKSRLVSPMKDADRIVQEWSELFFEPDIDNAHFISTKKLPIPKSEMEKLFKTEIFINKWEGGNPDYLELLKTNFIINLPRFIDIDTEFLNDQINELVAATEKAKSQGVPVDEKQILFKTQELLDSEVHNLYLKFIKHKKEEINRNNHSIAMLEELIIKTKKFDEYFFYIADSNGLPI